MKNIRGNKELQMIKPDQEEEKIGSTEPVRRGRGIKDDKIHRFC